MESIQARTQNLDTSLQKGQGFLMSALYAMITVCHDLAQNHYDVKSLTTLTHALVLGLFCKQTGKFSSTRSTETSSE